MFWSIQKLTNVQENQVSLQSKNDANENALASLQERLDTIFEVHVEGGDAHKVLEIVVCYETDRWGSH